MFIGITIGQLGKETGTAVETVRYYEKIGLLLQPARTASNYRSYGSGEVTRLRFIRRARDLGFNLGQVRTLLALADDQDRQCGEVSAIARENVKAVERKMADLKLLKKELSNLVQQCRNGRISDCRILEAFGPAARNVGEENCA